MNYSSITLTTASGAHLPLSSMASCDVAVIYEVIRDSESWEDLRDILWDLKRDGRIFDQPSAIIHDYACCKVQLEDNYGNVSYLTIEY